MINLNDTNILITCGPTWVPIDNMRVISNLSSGRLGQGLAQRLSRHGARVTLLEGPVASPLTDSRLQIIKYQFFHELQQSLQEQATSGTFHTIIHAAAVTDYQLAQPSVRKLSSDEQQMTLRLIPTPKIINTIKTWAPQVQLIGFKLLDASPTPAEIREKTTRLFTRANCDLIVANWLQPQYHALIVNREQHVLQEAESRKELIGQLMRYINPKQ